MSDQFVEILTALSLLKEPLAKQPILTFKNNLTVFRQLTDDEKKTVRKAIQYLEEIVTLIDVFHAKIKEFKNALERNNDFRTFIQEYQVNYADELTRAQRLTRFCNPAECKKTIRTVSILLESIFVSLEKNLLSKTGFIGKDSTGRLLEEDAKDLRAFMTYLRETFSEI